MINRELLPPRKKLKKLRELPRRHKDLPKKRRRILKRKSRRRDWSLSLLQKLQEKLKQLKPSPKLKQRHGKDWLRKLRQDLWNNRKLPLPLSLKGKLNSRPRKRESKQSMTLLLRLRKRLIDLPLWLLRLLINLPKLPEKLEKRSKLLLIKDRWLNADQLSRKPSEMCGPLEILVYHLSIWPCHRTPMSWSLNCTIKLW
jgi:hypothetical protein